MYYYSHHIGDFDLATRHLSRLERSIYRDLIEVYYETETQLTLDLPSLCRRIIARSTDEVTAVEQVLNEFFTKTPNGWYQARCEDELDKYRLSTSQKSVAGKASAAKREEKRLQALNGNSTGVEQVFNGASTNHKPLTTNHKPSTNKNKSAAKPLEFEYPAEFERVWAIYPVRPGANKKDSCKAWNARLKSGATYEQLFDGASLYAAYVAATNTEAKYIKQAVTFFGPSEHYKTDWVVPQGKQSRHNGFDSIDYTEGVTKDGRIA